MVFEEGQTTLVVQLVWGALHRQVLMPRQFLKNIRVVHDLLGHFNLVF